VDGLDAHEVDDRLIAALEKDHVVAAARTSRGSTPVMKPGLGPPRLVIIGTAGDLVVYEGIDPLP